MRLTVKQLENILQFAKDKKQEAVHTDNLPIELCKHIRFKWGSYRCTKMHWKECQCNKNGCLGYVVRG